MPGLCYLIDLKTIPADRLSDRDPKLAAIKAFGERESAQPEGLISESIEVKYAGAGKANASMHGCRWSCG